MINRISRLQDCAVFRDFAWPHDLPDLSDYNLIYGWNGTGKSTLTHVFRSLEELRVPDRGSVTLRIDDHDVAGSAFPQSDLPIRVFNRDFIIESVQTVTTGKGHLPPIVVIGAENVKVQKHLESELALLEDAEAWKNEAIRHLDRTRDRYEAFCTSEAQKIKTLLRSSGQDNRYNNYNRTTYIDDANLMLGAQSQAIHTLDDAEEKKFRDRIQSDAKAAILPVTFALPNLEHHSDELKQILEQTIVSRVLASLHNDSARSEWTLDGLRLHIERGSAQCLFCEQPLPSGRLEDLEAHFNQEFQRFLVGVDKKIAELEMLLQQVNAPNLPRTGELYQELLRDFLTSEKGLNEILADVKQTLAEMIQSLKQKRQQPFESLTFTLLLPQYDEGPLLSIKAIVETHNTLSAQHKARVTEAREKLAKNLIAISLSSYEDYNHKLAFAQAKLEEIRETVRQVQYTIAELKRVLLNHTISADELNADIRAYLGHGELELEVQETGYSIMRCGERATHLSEGETNALALLYFLKTLNMHDFDIKKSVIVLDDPVSSLDQNALFGAYSYIRARTVEAGQLIVLTHSFPFFRHMKNWFNLARTRKTRKVSYLMLTCDFIGERRCSSIGKLSRLLEDFDTEYHFLFNEVWQAMQECSQLNMARRYHLSNAARRLLEAFLAFRYPSQTTLWSQLERIDFDSGRKHRIYRLLNDGSHNGNIMEPQHDLSVLEELPLALADLLDLINAEDSSHFDGMVYACRNRS